MIRHAKEQILKSNCTDAAYSFHVDDELFVVNVVLALRTHIRLLSYESGPQTHRDGKHCDRRRDPSEDAHNTIDKAMVFLEIVQRSIATWLP